MISSDSLRMEKFETAISVIDKILPHLPDYSVFNFARYAKDILKWSDKDIREIALHEHEISHLALNQFQYVNEKTKGYFYELNDKGREAKSKGVHFLYLKYLADKVNQEKMRQLLNDEKLNYDVKNARRVFKTYWWTFWFSVVALIISLYLATLKLIEWFQGNS